MEGIVVPHINFQDNDGCIRMIEDPQTGVYAMLDEEAHLPSGTDKGYVEKLHKRYGEDGISPNDAYKMV